MTKRKKLIERLRNNPKNVTFDELKDLLVYLGFEYRKTGSSHYPFKHPKYPGLRIVVPYKSPFLKPIYVQLVLEELDKYHILEDLLD